MDKATKEHIFNRFHYCFETPEGRIHPPILDLQDLFENGSEFSVDGPGGIINIRALGLSHGPSSSFGFMFNNQLVYTPDVWSISDDVLNDINGATHWICDALRYFPIMTHAHADQTLAWQAKTLIQNIIMTNLHIDMDYEFLSQELPGPQSVAYDGMQLYI